MKKDMVDYKSKCYLGGISRTGRRKYNVLADKLLKKPIYHIVRSNTKPLLSITWSKTEFNDEFRVCSNIARTKADLVKIADIRSKSLDKKGWFENPKTMPEIPNTVKKLKDTKLVKS